MTSTPPPTSITTTLVGNTNDSDDDPEPSAGLTSASQCIVFHLPKSSSGRGTLSSSDVDEARARAPAKATTAYHTFHPVYTHQCFEQEYIPGYQPLSTSKERTPPYSAKERTHSSILRAQKHASSYLQMKILLHPLCTHCTIHIESFGIPQNQPQQQHKDAIDGNSNQEIPLPISKKRKLCTSTTSTTLATTTVPKNDKDKKITPCTKKLTVNEIVQSISMALPPISNIAIQSNNERDNHHNPSISKSSLSSSFFTTTKPMGIPIDEYNLQQPTSNDTSSTSSSTSSSPSTSYIVTFGSTSIHPKMATYHNQVQPLALWYIENASNVDLSSDEGGGFWNVLYLYQKKKKNECQGEEEEEQHSTDNDDSDEYQYSFVGYVTLFGFYSPFRKPKSGIILRICQMLILPPYQRCGHGKQLYQIVYNYIYGKYVDILRSASHGHDESKNHNNDSKDLLPNEDIVEVNVEDPSPAFEALRNRMDYEIFQKNYIDHCHHESLPSHQQPQEKKEDMLFLPSSYYESGTFLTIKDTDAIQAATKAKLSKTQIHIAYEIHKLQSKKHFDSNHNDHHNNNNNHHTTSATSNEKQEEIEKQYRLMVKRRLNHHHAEDIGACSTKEEKKEKLAALYGETIEKYHKILWKEGRCK